MVNINTFLTKGGGHYDPPSSFLQVAPKGQKILLNRFYDIEISSFAIILPKKVRGTTFNEVMVSRQMSKVGGVIATQPVLFNGKSTKIRFFVF